MNIALVVFCKPAIAQISTVNDVLEISDSLVSAFKFKDAYEVLDEETGRSLLSKQDSIRQAKILLQKGIVFYFLESIDSSVVCLNRAEQLATKLGIEDRNFWFELSACYGNDFNTQGNLVKAKESFDLAHTYLADDYDEFLHLSEFYNNYGYVLDKHGKYELAIDYYQKSVAYTKKAYGSKHDYVALGHNNIGYCYNLLGEFEKAEEHYKKALDIRSELYDKDHLNISRCYNNLGTLYGELGHTEKAVKYHSMAMKIREKHFAGQPNGLLINSYSNLAQELVKKEKYQEGIELFERIIQLLEKDYDNRYAIHLGIAYTQLGACMINMKEYEKARVYLNKSLEVYKTYPHQNITLCLNNIANSHATLGTIYHHQKNYPLSMKQSLKALALKDHMSKISHVTLLNNIGNTLYQQKNYERAEEYFDEAANLIGYDPIKEKKISKQILDKKIEIAPLVYSNLAAVNLLFFERRGKREYLDHAVAYNNASLEFLTSNVNQRVETSDLVMLLERFDPIMNNCYNVYQKAYESSYIQEFYEKTKAFKNIITTQINQLYTQNASSQYRLLKTKTANYRNRLSDDKLDTNEREELQRRILVLDQKIDSILFKNRDKNVLGHSYRTPDPDVEKGVLKIDFFTTKDSCHIFFSTSDDLEHQVLGTDIICEFVDYYKTSMEDDQYSLDSLNLLGLELSKQIFGQYYDHIQGYNRIEILPDGCLYGLPFESLRIASNGKTKYLVELAEIIYPMPNQRFDFVCKNPKYLGIAPDYVHKTALGLNKKEVEEASSHFSNSKIFEKRAATKANFLQYFNKYDILHLAAHASKSDSLSNESYIFLNDETEDNTISFSELSSLDLSDKCSVLSACHTASGEIKSGIGMLSLSKALEISNSKCSIVSILEANDVSTYSILNGFYENVSEGNTFSHALREAKLNFLESPEVIDELKHPRNWAGLVLIGDMKVEISQNNTRTFMYLLLAVLLGLLAFFTFKKTRKSNV